MQVGHHYVMARLPLKWIGPGQCLIVDTAHRIQVRPRVQRHPLELLGSHEKNRAEDRLQLFQLLLGLRLRQRRQAEVHDLHLKFPGGQPGQHQVRGLDVAMDQIQFLRRDERLLRLDRQLTEIIPCQRCALDQFVQRLAIDQLHHHVGPVRVGAHVVDRHDVRMLQRGQRARFLDELPGAFLHQRRIILRHRNALDRHLPVHPRVISPVDRSQASLADFSADFVTFFHDLEVPQRVK